MLIWVQGASYVLVNCPTGRHLEESAGNTAPSYLIASAGLLDPLKQNVGTGESGRGI